MALYRKQQERNGNWSVVRNADNVTLYTGSNEYKADRYLGRVRGAQARDTKRKNAQERLKGFKENPLLQDDKPS